MRKSIGDRPSNYLNKSDLNTAESKSNLTPKLNTSENMDLEEPISLKNIKFVIPENKERLMRKSIGDRPSDDLNKSDLNTAESKSNLTSKLNTSENKDLEEPISLKNIKFVIPENKERLMRKSIGDRPSDYLNRSDLNIAESKSNLTSKLNTSENMDLEQDARINYSNVISPRSDANENSKGNKNLVNVLPRKTHYKKTIHTINDVSKEFNNKISQAKSEIKTVVEHSQLSDIPKPAYSEFIEPNFLKAKSYLNERQIFSFEEDIVSIKPIKKVVHKLPLIEKVQNNEVQEIQENSTTHEIQAIFQEDQINQLPHSNTDELINQIQQSNKNNKNENNLIVDIAQENSYINEIRTEDIINDYVEKTNEINEIIKFENTDAEVTNKIDLTITREKDVFNQYEIINELYANNQIDITHGNQPNNEIQEFININPNNRINQNLEQPNNEIQEILEIDFRYGIQENLEIEPNNQNHKELAIEPINDTNKNFNTKTNEEIQKNLDFAPIIDAKENSKIKPNNQIEEVLEVKTTKQIKEDLEIESNEEIQENIEIEHSKEIKDDLEIKSSKLILEKLEIVSTKETNEILQIKPNEEIQKNLDLVPTIEDKENLQIQTNNQIQEILGIEPNNETYENEESQPRNEIQNIVVIKSTKETQENLEILPSSKNMLNLQIQPSNQNHFVDIETSKNLEIQNTKEIQKIINIHHKNLHPEKESNPTKEVKYTNDENTQKIDTYDGNEIQKNFEIYPIKENRQTENIQKIYENKKLQEIYQINPINELLLTNESVLKLNGKIDNGQVKENMLKDEILLTAKINSNNEIQQKKDNDKEIPSLENLKIHFDNSSQNIDITEENKAQSKISVYKLPTDSSVINLKNQNNPFDERMAVGINTNKSTTKGHYKPVKSKLTSSKRLVTEPSSKKDVSMIMEDIVTIPDQPKPRHDKLEHPSEGGCCGNESTCIIF
jgi:hypothetical protein